MEWTKKSRDMIDGTSKQFYSIAEIETQLESAQKMELALVELSEWTDRLAAKLDRARAFEAEAWNAIRACTQPVMMGAGDEDDCILTLKILKDEASPSSLGNCLATADHPYMINLNPLGRHTRDSSSGLTMPSSLTRGVINDSIVVRRWILDLNQAKVVRERTTFVQDIIQRYVTLPQLPTPPSSNGLVGAAAANPSAILAANTKDSITILSSSCYSYNHIIGNAESRLHGSSKGNSPHDLFLRTKEGVSSMLAELVRLPVLSVVEEKLHMREELIDWNDEAQQSMKAVASTVPFPRIEALAAKLSSILSLSSMGRTKVCQKLKPDQFVDDQIRSFAAADEITICASSSAWVLHQCKRGTEWMAHYNEIVALLESQGYSFGENEAGRPHAAALGNTAAAAAPTSQDGLVSVDMVCSLLEEHDAHLVTSFPEEYGRLSSVRQNIQQWVDSIDHAVLTGSLTLQQRCDLLGAIVHERPKGISIEPTGDAITLWRRALTWRVNLQQVVKTTFDHWKKKTSTSQMGGSDCQEINRLVSSVLAPLITEGQDFLIPNGYVGNNGDSGVLPPFLSKLRMDALRSMQRTHGKSSFKKSEMLDSGKHGKTVMDRILDMEADKAALIFARRVFWMMIQQAFFAHLEKTDFGGDLIDAKALLSICPLGLVGSAENSLMDTNAEEARLQEVINHATDLENKSTTVLDRCMALLRSNCYSHKEEVRACLVSLSDIRSSFNDKRSALAVKLLRDKTIETKLDRKIKGLTWLLGTFAYDLFHQNFATSYQQPVTVASNSDRIHINNVRDLRETMPFAITLQGKVTEGDCLDNEIVRISKMVKDLWDRAYEWQTKTASLIPTSNNDDVSFGVEGNEFVVFKLEELIWLSENQILSQVIIPEAETLQNITTTAGRLRERLETELFGEYKHNGTDVNNARLPEGTSLVANNGDFVLHRFTGSQMYVALNQALKSIKETAATLPLQTPERATLEWMASIFDWVEAIQHAGHYNVKGQLVITIEHAMEILEQGHVLFYSISDEARLYLRGKKVGLRVFPQALKVDTTAVRDEAYTLGLGLLRWAALLFTCLKSDIEIEDRWKVRTLEATGSFLAFESDSMGGMVPSFKGATKFKDNVDFLISEASNLIIQDDRLEGSLFSLHERMKKNASFQKSLEVERLEVEEKKYLQDKEKFESPQNIVNDRFELLGCLLQRLPFSDETEETLLGKSFDGDSMFVGEPSVRDKSRFFLEKSLWTGMETLGLDPKESDARDFCSTFAWNLEDAVNEKFHQQHTDTLAPMSNAYRDKIRSLRFNLQDPKNPMLCARVIAGNVSIEELITASTEDLASNELKLRRRKVEEDAIKNVVLSADIANMKHPPPAVITSDLAAKICIDSRTTQRSQSSPDSDPTPPMKFEERNFQDDGQVLQSADASLKSGSLSDFKYPPIGSLSSSSVHLKETNQILESIPPPPMRRIKNEPTASTPEPVDDQYDSPPPSPLLSAMESAPPSVTRRAHHITSQSGTDMFHITISKLRLSFTTKIVADESCKFDVDRFLPSIWVEKGRLTLDQFNKFTNEKAKSGRWDLAYLKLSSITGSNMRNYKKFYKEYESLGRLTMIQVSETTKIFLVTPKFLRVCKCLNHVENLSRSSTYVVVLTKEPLPRKH